MEVKKAAYPIEFRASLNPPLNATPCMKNSLCKIDIPTNNGGVFIFNATRQTVEQDLKSNTNHLPLELTTQFIATIVNNKISFEFIVIYKKILNDM